jgi:hypothetical protein
MPETTPQYGATQLVAMTQDDFQEAITPKPLTEEEKVFYFTCPTCGNKHFRHAGYMETLMPFVRANKQKVVSCESIPVKVCTKCKDCFIWINESMRNVTSDINVEAWETTERELHKATGPGGDC